MVGRDLNDEMEAYIVESALELPERYYRLVIHVVEPGADTDNKETIAAAVRSYFAYLSKVQARRLRLLLREGRQALVMGLGFLTLCWGLGFIATQTVAEPFGESMKRQRETLDALADMDVHLRIDQPYPAAILKLDPDI